jgi:hypothetical protein
MKIDNWTLVLRCLVSAPPLTKKTASLIIVQFSQLVRLQGAPKGKSTVAD